MRILHVLRDVRDVGNGVTNIAVDMAAVQRQIGHRVAMASGGGEYEELLESSDVIHYDLRENNRPTSLARNYLRLRSVVREFDPEIVHCHLVPGTVLAWLVRLPRKYALVAHIHNVQKMRSMLMGLADGVIAVSQAVADTMHKRGIPNRKLFVVRNCVVGSPRRKQLSTTLPKYLSQPAIVTVAGMSRRKNIDGLIAAFETIGREFPAANLYLVGDGPHRKSFEALAVRSRFADRIHFEGFQRDPRAYIQSASVFVLVSRRESFGLALHEAREVGVAIIGSDVDGIAEALDHGRAGLLVPVGDVCSLASAFRQLLSNPDVLDQWKRASIEGIERHTVFRMGEELLAVYRRFLRDGGPEIDRVDVKRMVS